MSKTILALVVATAVSMGFAGNASANTSCNPKTSPCVCDSHNQNCHVCQGTNEQCITTKK